MPSPDTLSPFVAYVTRGWPGRECLRPGQMRDCPVLVIPFDGEPPPMWPVGTEVRCNLNADLGEGEERTVCSAFFLYRRRWSFIDDNGKVRVCKYYEPVPTTASVTLRVTGSPEEVERIRRDFAPGVQDPKRHYPYPWPCMEVAVDD